MFDKEKLDCRTITMGISLLDCAHSNGEIARQRMYDKITQKAENLVSVGESIEREYGIPIIHKRISVTPMALVAGASTDDDYVAFAKMMDRAAKETGVNFIGGFSALVQKGFSKGDEILIRSIPQALSETELCLFFRKRGIHAVRYQYGRSASDGRKNRRDGGADSGQRLHRLRKTRGLRQRGGRQSVHGGSFSRCRRAGYGDQCGSQRSRRREGRTGKPAKGSLYDVVADTIKKAAFKVTRMGMLVASEASKRLGMPFGIVDLSLAPTPAVGDSIARVLEEIGLEACGAPGTTAALAMLNDAVKKGGVMASSHVGGLSGAFIPVSEDEGMIDGSAERRTVTGKAGGDDLCLLCRS